MTGQGFVDGKVKIDMIHPQQIEPEMGGTSTGDYITIKGSPAINMSNTPEVEGGIGTYAMCVNTDSTRHQRCARPRYYDRPSGSTRDHGRFQRLHKVIQMTF